MAGAAAARGLPFLHVSTDYVFDGRPGRPWQEEDQPAPVNAYGASKLAGERAVQAAGGAQVILRTAWVFSAHGSNFVSAMLRLGASGERLRVVEDQRSGPTPATDVAETLLTIAAALVEGRGATGIFHFTGAPAASRADFAEAVFAARGGDMPVMERIATSEWPSAAVRPLNTVLDCGRIAKAYGIAQPDWRAGLAQVVGELP
jgi:dTDP-4-dehydrorhamnose reductase